MRLSKLPEDTGDGDGEKGVEVVWRKTVLIMKVNMEFLKEISILVLFFGERGFGEILKHPKRKGLGPDGCRLIA